MRHSPKSPLSISLGYAAVRSLYNPTVQSIEERTDYIDTGAKPRHAMYPIYGPDIGFYHPPSSEAS